MGTNYYWSNFGDTCPLCGSVTDEDKHIGKSSAGWCFSLHVYPEDGINDLADWQKLWEHGNIFNEYGEEVDPKDMLDIITNRACPVREEPESYANWKDFHHQNHSQDGPNGLIRHNLGKHCVSHGEGTWDCIVGEFC